VTQKRHLQVILRSPPGMLCRSRYDDVCGAEAIQIVRIRLTGNQWKVENVSREIARHPTTVRGRSPNSRNNGAFSPTGLKTKRVAISTMDRDSGRAAKDAWIVDLCY
jgi:hypothetical protein